MYICIYRGRQLKEMVQEGKKTENNITQFENSAFSNAFDENVWVGLWINTVMHLISSAMGLVIFHYSFVCSFFFLCLTKTNLTIRSPLKAMKSWWAMLTMFLHKRLGNARLQWSLEQARYLLHSFYPFDQIVCAMLSWNNIFNAWGTCA